MKILLHGLNFAPEEIGIGKYSGEMIAELAARGHECCVVTTPPYYPAWKIESPWKAWRYEREKVEGQREEGLGRTSQVSCGVKEPERGPSPGPDSPTSPASGGGDQRGAASESGGNEVMVIRCPLWVPKKVTGLKRVIHLASFGFSSLPVVVWKALTFRPDVILTVEPAAMCMPTTWVASRISGAKCWLHVQDFEVDAAFDLGILKQPFLQKVVLALEGFLMRRFDRVSSISPNMLLKAAHKGVDETRLVEFPNWVDCEVIHPLPDGVTEAAEGLRRRRRSFALPESASLALYAGNVGKKQGLEIVLHAAQRVPGVSFVICGTGADARSLQEDSAGLANVHWLPPQPLNRFNDLLNCADIHLLPQRGGAADLVMPSKLTGMLASGRAIVACADAGTQIADVVNRRGIVVPAGDAQSFAEAVACLADDPERRQLLGKAGREYAVRSLSKDAILTEFERDIWRLCDRRVSVQIDRSTPAESVSVE